MNNIDINNLKNDKDIDEAYDRMIKMADSIKDLKNENIKDEEVLNTEVEEITDPIKEKNLAIYNQATGEVSVDPMADLKKISSMSFRSFISDDGEFDSTILDKYLDPETLKDKKAIETLNSLIKRRLNGDKFNVYNEMPDIFRERIDSIANTKDKNLLNFAATKTLDSMVAYYKANNASTAVMDLDAMLAGFEQEEQVLVANTAQEIATNIMDHNESRKADIDRAITQCTVEGKTEAITKLQDMKDTIDEAYTLKKFSEFCSTVKIKKFDLEKPSRVYSSFIQKYTNHKYNINNIQDCPAIICRHLTDISEVDALRVCLAFCKYTMNWNPDNIKEHTFMYYFIRNIILLDRINPKGKVYDSMDDRSKKFYDEFTNNLRTCISNIKK